MTGTVTAVLVGCGRISETWLQAVREVPEISLAGFVDLNEAAARARADAFGYSEAITGSDLSGVLRHIRPAVVFDCTVPEAHRTVGLTALAHGCHVLGEKPLADSMAHAAEVVAAARQAGLLYAVIQNRRYLPQIRRLAAFLASGALGDITTVNSDFYIGAHFGGFREQMQHVLLLDMAIHTFDAARLVSGADPLSVVCREWNPQGSWYAHGASAVAVFNMTGGIVYTYRGSWCAEGLNTPWECEWRVTGTKGSVCWDGRDTFAAQVVQATGTFFSTLQDIAVPPLDQAARIGGHAGVIKEFVHCVQTGTLPETICTDNIKSLAMVFGAIDSADTSAWRNIESA